MVDVTAKPATAREAAAVGSIRMALPTLEKIQAGQGPKGNVVETARLAGIMAAKQTSHLIPLCHPLPLGGIEVSLTPDPHLPGYRIRATVKTTSQTGVEMEALTAVSVAALTLYDMAKALDRSMVIEGIQVIEKIGGKSGHWHTDPSLSAPRAFHDHAHS
ncbi:MAG: cyclic pyranopterin monophosphate synthase MoaC [Synechococcaceae cyanobacterium SM2_3_1]|nr:cyclic pyranopterin monophosphate synthase MoaC [Synechococcaceae cyanobacterium SM2_3_1]